MRYRELHEGLRKAVLNAGGDTSPALRRAVMERARTNRTVDADLADQVTRYVDTVARHAYKVTDADVTALREAHSDDAVFEITVAAAVGAAFHRLERGLAALGGQEPD